MREALELQATERAVDDVAGTWPGSGSHPAGLVQIGSVSSPEAKSGPRLAREEIEPQAHGAGGPDLVELEARVSGHVVTASIGGPAGADALSEKPLDLDSLR